MKCPHCGTSIHLSAYSHEFSTGREHIGDPIAQIHVGFCPECKKAIIHMDYGYIEDYYGDDSAKWDAEYSEQVYPQNSFIPALDNSIPQKYANEFYEASNILFFSPKASATLSRYLLQLILHEELGIQKRNLEEEIAELETKDIISANLAKMLQIFRKIANFGAHPKKNTNTGEIVEVAQGEAEIMLDLLRELFDCLFVKPNQQRIFLDEIKDKYGIDI